MADFGSMGCELMSDSDLGHLKSTSSAEGKHLTAAETPFYPPILISTFHLGFRAPIQYLVFSTKLGHARNREYE